MKERRKERIERRKYGRKRKTVERKKEGLGG